VHTNLNQEPFAIASNFQLRLLTPIDVARCYALHPHTVSKYLCGAIQMDLPKAFKVGGQWRFREDDVRQHIDKLSGRASLEPTSPPPTATATQTTPIRSRGRPRKVVAVGSAA
jgi:Helix-turn-helix domain